MSNVKLPPYPALGGAGRVPVKAQSSNQIQSSNAKTFRILAFGIHLTFEF
jgi:hypothetical protein